MRHLALVAIVGAVACSQAQPKNTYTLQGQILSIEAPRKTLTIKHGDIKGLMPAMTMPYSVKDDGLLNGLAPGDFVDATLVVESNNAFLSAIRKTGHAALAAADVPAAPSYASGVDVLQPGDTVPDAPFVNQDGKRVRFASFKGAPVVITFIYTRCPLPEFCPLMDRHFAEMQGTLGADPALARVHLVSVSFDPETDTPTVLKAHAQSLKADPQRWTFLTGDRSDIDRFAARFGVVASRDAGEPQTITHNLRTAIVGPDGKVAKVYTGNDWTPAQVLADLRAMRHDS